MKLRTKKELVLLVLNILKDPRLIESEQVYEQFIKSDDYKKLKEFKKGSLNSPEGIYELFTAIMHLIRVLSQIGDIEVLVDKIDLSWDVIEALFGNIPETYHILPYDYFNYGYKFDSVYEVPDGVKIICSDSFLNCRGLQKIVIPESVEILGYDAKESTNGMIAKFCKDLKEINLPSKWFDQKTTKQLHQSLTNSLKIKYTYRR